MAENIVAIEGLDTLLEMLIQKYERLKSQYDLFYVLMMIQMS